MSDKQATRPGIGSRGSAEMPLVEMHIFEVNRQAGSRLSASSSTSRFGKFGGRIASVIAKSVVGPRPLLSLHVMDT